MHQWVKNWQDVLDSLATAGGNIVTLFWCSVFSACLFIWCFRHSGVNEVTMGVYGIFTGFTGALLQAQKGNSSRQQMTDRIETSGGPRPIQPGVTQSSETVIRTQTNPPPTKSVENT